MSERERHPDPLIETFRQGCARNQLLYQTCSSCGAVQFYPRALCRTCHGRDLEWQRSSGNGRVSSFTVVHRGPRRDVAVPYVLALVDVEEGFRILTGLVRCEPDEVELGQAVRIVFEDGPQGRRLPQTEIIRSGA